MNRRFFILEELGLQPLWVRRSPRVAASAHDASSGDASPLQASLVQEIAAHTPVLPTPVPPVTQQAPSKQRAIKAASTSAGHDDPAPAAVPQIHRPDIAHLDWTALAEAVKGCSACGLCDSRTQTVFAAGQPGADLLVVGEAPGAEEDRQGQPFVGPAGKLLDAMLASIGQQRGRNTCIANALKCRPPQNRNPQAEEMLRCTPFLHRQIELIAPKAILAVGKFAILALLDRSEPIRQLRGQSLVYQGIPVVVSYHPAYLLRNPVDKAKAWEDLLRIKHLIQNPRLGDGIA